MKNRNKYRARLVPGILGIIAAAAATARGQDSAPADNASAGQGSVPGDMDVSGSFLTRSSALWSNPQWQELRRVWRKMDELTVTEGAGLSSSEETRKLRIELDTAFNELGGVSEELGLQALEFELLRTLAYRRMDFISYGTSMPLTRMMPPPVYDQTAELVPVIEARIDVLVQLREEGVLTGSEMEEAFSDLRTTIDLFYLLESINRQVDYSSPLWMERWPADQEGISRHIDSLRTAMLDELDVGDAAHGEMREGLILEFDELEEALEKTRARLPVLHDMLLSLELL